MKKAISLAETPAIVPPLFSSEAALQSTKKISGIRKIISRSAADNTYESSGWAIFWGQRLRVQIKAPNPIYEKRILAFYEWPKAEDRYQLVSTPQRGIPAYLLSIFTSVSPNDIDLSNVMILALEKKVPDTEKLSRLSAKARCEAFNIAKTKIRNRIIFPMIHLSLLGFMIKLSCSYQRFCWLTFRLLLDRRKPPKKRKPPLEGSHGSLLEIPSHNLLYMVRD